MAISEGIKGLFIYGLKSNGRFSSFGKYIGIESISEHIVESASSKNVYT